MKTVGWIFVAIGSLSLIGAATAGHNATGPVFWLALGIFLIYRATQKRKDEEDREKWKNE